MKHELAVLAAWLHDVGKFAQRAGAPASKGLEQEICPQGKTHRHVLYTDWFIEHDLPLPPDLEGQRSRLARIASAHHRPDSGSREEMVLQRADRLSSGGDRIAGEAEGDYRTARLESIFQAIRLDGKGLDAAPRRYQLRPLDAGLQGEDSPIFPRPEEECKTPAYTELWDEFCQALKAIPLDLGVRHYLHSLATVLEHFTWCIPSSTYKTRADISLYDHAATTAAIAQALLACPDGEEGFLLFGADVSGIQKFIFGETGHADGGDRGANKLLRARSFLVQALARSVWLTLLERLDLTQAARIMDAGGRFVLLLPDTEAARQELDLLEREVEPQLLQEFQGSIRMTFARLPLRPDDLERQNFLQCFETFNNQLERAKLHPFARSLQEGLVPGLPVLPVDHDAYRQFGECQLCRMRPAEAPQEEDEPRMCPQCRQLVRVGRRLPSARYLLFDRQAGGLPLFGGLTLRLEKEAPRDAQNLVDIVSIRDRTAFSAMPVAGFIPTVTQDDLERWKNEGRLQERDGNPSFAGEPCDRNAPKTFAMLAQEASIQTPDGKWRCLPCLAACKADVDNLGLLFGLGFDRDTPEESCFSISRFAMLSRMMNHFFGAHLVRVIEREFPNIYVIFAGGDDLFVLGPWPDTIRFAQRLHRDFEAFSGHHPAVTLSAGLPLFKSRLPMRSLREMAEQALDRAKLKPEKNAATLFNVTASWQQFDTLLEEGRWLEGLCLKKHLTQGLLRRMLGYARECRDFTRGEIRKGLYLSHLTYDLARNGADDLQKQAPEDLQRLQQLGQDKNRFPLAELGITWALYRTRISE